VKAKRTIHVLTDKKGALVGGGILTSAKDRKGKGVHVQISPMKGQTISEVSMPSEIQRLEGREMFCRLRTEYHLPRGEKELVRRVGRRKKA
jgi:hypothetical protein